MPAAVPNARHTIREFALHHGADAEVRDAMAMCVTEAVTNAVVHAYRDRTSPGDVEMEMERVDGALCVQVRDTGSGITPQLGTRGLGIGLPLMANLAKPCELRATAGGGTEVMLRFPLLG